MRAARSTADLAACWIGRTNVKDFLIDWYKGPQTPEEIEDAMRAAFGAPPRAR